MATKVRAKPKSRKPRQRIVRLTPALFELVEEAAIRSGVSIEAFTSAILESSARDVILRETVTVLSQRDSARVLTIINSKSKPNATLTAAVEKYRKHFGKD